MKNQLESTELNLQKKMFSRESPNLQHQHA